MERMRATSPGMRTGSPRELATGRGELPATSESSAQALCTQSEGQAGGSCGSWRPVEPTGPRAHAERELVSTTGSYKSQGWDKVGLSAALREKAQLVCSGELTRGDPGPCSGALMSTPSGAILNH
ncbi:unnamed protein product [Rangifer tarandus platyrhynchus]|uniref:Uncharacterized protein n=1 Tax=Rangifer tarandus platyrhynchus TaxID=3082113 RepID=A0AC59ZML3_RANTA